jgi:hypothetical protein
MQILLPCDDTGLRAEVTQREPYEVYSSQYLQYDVEKLLSKLIGKELSFAKQIEHVKQELASYEVKAQ